MVKPVDMKLLDTRFIAIDYQYIDIIKNKKKLEPKNSYTLFPRDSLVLHSRDTRFSMHFPNKKINVDLFKEVNILVINTKHDYDNKLIFYTYDDIEFIDYEKLFKKYDGICFTEKFIVSAVARDDYIDIIDYKISFHKLFGLYKSDCLVLRNIDFINYDNSVEVVSIYDENKNNLIVKYNKL